MQEHEPYYYIKKILLPQLKVVAVLTVFMAVATYYYLSFYLPHSFGVRHSLGSLIFVAAFVFVYLSTIVIFISAILALIFKKQNQVFQRLFELHIGFIISFLLLSPLIFGNGDLNILFSLLSPALFLNALSLVLINFSIKEKVWKPEFIIFPVFIIITGMFLGGMPWSLQMPAKVIAEAEKIAGRQPYCIKSAGHLAESRLDLTGLSMYVPAYHGVYWDYYGLLIVQNSDAAKMYNWSYKSDTFMPLTDLTVKAMHLELCQPKQNFASTLRIM